MPAKLLRTITVGAVCLIHGALAAAGEQVRHAPAAMERSATSARSTGPLKTTLHGLGRNHATAAPLAADRDPYADPAAPYKANRLSSSRAEPILNEPGQSTVLTRQVLDDMNATSLRDALQSTAGVTVGR
jgi:outer membrane receptor for monomeric catechols